MAGVDKIIDKMQRQPHGIKPLEAEKCLRLMVIEPIGREGHTGNTSTETVT